MVVVARWCGRCRDSTTLRSASPLLRAREPPPQELRFGAVEHRLGEVLDAVRELKLGGLTIVMATHEMGFAREVADRVCFLSDGIVLEQGPPEEIFSDPRQEQTQQFLARVLA